MHFGSLTILILIQIVDRFTRYANQFQTHLYLNLLVFKPFQLINSFVVFVIVFIIVFNTYYMQLHSINVVRHNLQLRPSYKIYIWNGIMYYQIRIKEGPMYPIRQLLDPFFLTLLEAQLKLFTHSIKQWSVLKNVESKYYLVSPSFIGNHIENLICTNLNLRL